MSTFSSDEQFFEDSFSKLELPDQHYRSIEFEECQFLDCDFSGVKFQNCKFFNCRFESCNLSLLNLANSKLFGITFQDSKLVGIDWTKATWPEYHSDFELEFQRCILNDSSFFGLTLNEIILNECKLRDVDFREGDFTASTMTHCDFTHSLFMRTNLQRVDFSESSGHAIDVLNNPVNGARFSRYEALILLECLGVELVD